MGEVIDLNKFRATKTNKKTSDNSAADAIRDSLDNDAVKRRYGIKTPPPPAPAKTMEDRLTNIKQSIDRINSIMAELNDVTKPTKEKTK